jgi:hypothetical protein
MEAILIGRQESRAGHFHIGTRTWQATGRIVIAAAAQSIYYPIREALAAAARQMKEFARRQAYYSRPWHIF